MVDAVSLSVILGAHIIATASPGPATLALAGTSMASGRKYGIALAAGITCGSLMWSVLAAVGFGTIMLAHAWIFEAVRYLGATYLLYLAYKSARSAIRSRTLEAQGIAARSLGRTFLKGFLLHATNPKAILFFGSIYAIAIPPGTEPGVLAGLIALLGVQSVIIFQGYALMFSSRAVTRFYIRLRRWLEAGFALAFGAAGLAILTARVN